ncbi:cation diffusion facilitator family transporter [Cohnella sp. CFH 77786]|uniref:cation diffusion facilitator family transporter n=1 Tax=Cohnella sp. CFH 77786 TaxID=2662265 RepID=UPI001C60CC61|nr:cation diffusion facilitator family transporter [Cohnella sp. CFH 77786]MBW5446881.1 cation diffusion facilitator family transporter [Cohnella sp. CFH 77786]
MRSNDRHGHDPGGHGLHTGHPHGQGHDHGQSHGQSHEHSHGHHHGHDHHGHHHHGHHHGHGHAFHHGHAHDFSRDGNRKGLTIALLITSGILLLEFIGGLLTNSLALLSDSGHMLSDAGALLLSLAAIRLSARPASPRKTYGFHRFEILAALFNGVALFLIAGFVIWEAVRRFAQPPEVAGGAMTAIAAIGLLANLASAWALMRKGDVKNNVNLRSAYLHVIGDALGSLGAIAAGILMSAFGWYAADPIVSILVSVLILKSAWGIIRHTVHVLMEGTPASVDRGLVQEALLAIDGVTDVHDLHIWTITSGFDSMSCHVRTDGRRDSQEVLQQALRILEDRFHLAHVTVQVESPEIGHGEMCR